MEKTPSQLVLLVADVHPSIVLRLVFACVHKILSIMNTRLLKEPESVIKPSTSASRGPRSRCCNSHGSRRISHYVHFFLGGGFVLEYISCVGF